MKKTLFALGLCATLGFGLPAHAAEPSLHQVYQAAEAGRLDEAQRMMHEVLASHPGSGKAHYVEAELLAKQGQLSQAARELATAEKLAPGLPFANPQSVTHLRQLLNVSAVPAAALAVGAPVGQEAGLPWGMILLGLGLIAFIVLVSKWLAARNAIPVGAGNVPVSGGHGGYGGYAAASPATPYGATAQGYAGPMATPAAGPGMGSQILGGLATGAAVGAGVVAGEALMHHLMGGDKSSSSSSSAQGLSSFEAINATPTLLSDDLGGQDFGIADTGSWDDGGASGDSDWN